MVKVQLMWRSIKSAYFIFIFTTIWPQSKEKSQNVFVLCKISLLFCWLFSCKNFTNKRKIWLRLCNLSIFSRSVLVFCQMFGFQASTGQMWKYGLVGISGASEFIICFQQNLWKIIKYFGSINKLDGVGPVDNRPSTN